MFELKGLISAKIIYIFLSLLVAVLFFGNFSTAAEPKKIALLPFKINSEKDLTFLKDGIFDMLPSRLSKEGEVEVLAREQIQDALQAEAGSGTVNEAKARKIGARPKWTHLTQPKTAPEGAALDYYSIVMPFFFWQHRLNR